MLIAIGTLAATVLGLLVAVGTLYLQNIQLKRDLKKETEYRKKETEYKKNAADHQYAGSCLMAIGRRWITLARDGQGEAFWNVFKDVDLRRRIGIYLGSRNSVGDFIPYQLTADQLGNPECCQTIGDVISAVEKARGEEWADKLSLPNR